MDYKELEKLKTFFSELKKGGYKSNLNQIPTSIRAESLALLRKLPQFQTEDFKDDNVLINAVNEYLRDPSKRRRFLDEAEFTHQQQEEFIEALEEPVVVEEAGGQPSEQPTEQAPVGEQPSTMTGGSSFPGMPTGGVSATPRRVIRRVPQTRPPLAGMEGGSGAGTAATNKAAGLAGKEPLPNLPRRSVAGMEGGSGSGIAASNKVPYQVTNTAKNFVSRAKIFVNRNLMAIARTGLGGFAGGALTGFNPLAMVGGGAAGFSFPAWGKKALNGSINAGIRLSNAVSRGGLNLAGPKKKLWLLFLGMFGAFFLFSAFTGATTPSGGSIPVPGGGSGTGGNCPDQTTINANKQDPNTCRYFGLGVDLFDSNITQPALDAYINRYSSIFVNARKGDLDEFKARVTYIVTKSKEVGLNPTLALGYWKTESNFSTVGSRDLGCHASAINFYEQVDCKLGINAFSDPSKNPIANCAKSKDANSAACTALKGIRRTLDSTNPIKYPISTFDDFAEAYGSRDPGLDGPGVVNNNCVSTYNKLVEVATELNQCKVAVPVTPAPGGPVISGSVVSCPLEGKRTISCGSFMSDPKYNTGVCSGPLPQDRGHCGLTYGCYDSNNRKITDPTAISNLRRAHSIDVNAPAGEIVKLPFIQGQTLNWTPSGRYGPLSSTEGGGYGHFFTATSGSDTWVIHLTHMNPDKIPPPAGRATYQSGDPVTTVAATGFTHLHVNIGRNPTGADGGRGWLDPESLGMCVN